MDQEPGDREPPAEPPAQPTVFGDRIVTVPNLISVARLACVPWFLWLLFSQDDRWGAALVFAGVGITDWVDGWWARRFHSVSELGKLLDPIADRIVLIVGVFAVAIDGAVPWWLAVLTLAREVMVGIAGLVIGAFGARRIDVTWWGKCATFALLFAFPSLLAGASDGPITGFFTWFGWICAIPGLVYSYLSAAEYVPIARRALSEGRAARAG